MTWEISALSGLELWHHGVGHIFVPFPKKSSFFKRSDKETVTFILASKCFNSEVFKVLSKSIACGFSTLTHHLMQDNMWMLKQDSYY